MRFEVRRDSLESTRLTGGITATSHPTFPNPTVQEALCEIHFRRADDVPWEATLFGDLFKALEPDFPRLEPVAELGFQVELGPDGITPGVLPPRQRMRYHHAQRHLLVQLAEGILTVNVLPVYAGWRTMRSDILSVWTKAVAVLKPAVVTRVGLRYINRIDRESPEQTAGSWLRQSDHIPSAALDSASGFLSRVQSVADQGRRTIVTLGETAEQDGDMAAFVLDIDCIVETALPTSAQALGDAIDALHERAWSVFASSITPQLELLLGGEGNV